MEVEDSKDYVGMKSSLFIDITEDLFNNLFVLFFSDIGRKNAGVLPVKIGKGLCAVILLVALIIFPAYSCYFSLVEANLSPTNLSYESTDQDGLSVNPQSEFRGFGPNVPSVSLLHGENLFKLLLDFSYQTPPTDRQPSILRC